MCGCSVSLRVEIVVRFDGERLSSFLLLLSCCVSASVVDLVLARSDSAIAIGLFPFVKRDRYRRGQARDEMR